MTAVEGFAISWAGASVLVTITIAACSAVVAAFWWVYRRLADQSAEMADDRLHVARTYVPLTSFAVVEKRVVSVEQAVGRLAEVINLLPDKEQAHRLELAMEGIRGQVGVLAEQIKPVSAMSSRMQELLMERSR